MLKQSHHLQIVQILRQLNPGLIKSCQIAFGGGTAISLLHDEYRLSTDIDFMCCSPTGYKALREIFFTTSRKKKFLGELTEVREFSSGKDSVRGVVKIDNGTPIKMEFVFEARMVFEPFATRLSSLAGLESLPVLSTTDLFTEKLMANIDRGIDTAFNSRDLIDLCIMLKESGKIPDDAIQKFRNAYGLSRGLLATLEKTKDLLRDSNYLKVCLKAMQIDPKFESVVTEQLDNVTFPFDERAIRFRPQG